MLGSSSTYITPVRPEPICAGQADALRLAAAERLGAAVQAQVIEAHVVEKLQTQANLAHHLGGNLGLGTVQAQAVEIVRAPRPAWRG
jgi:hypothetical protein